MFVFLIKLTNFAFNLLSFIIIFDAILSFFPLNKTYNILEYIKKISNFLLNPIRNLTKNFDIGIDFSPLIAIVLLKVLETILISFFRLFI